MDPEYKKVSFDTDQQYGNIFPPVYSDQAKGMTGWLMRVTKGKVRKKSQAQVILTLGAVMAILVSIFLFVRAAPNSTEFSPREMKELEKAGSSQDPGLRRN